MIGGFPEDFSSFTGSTNGLAMTFYYLMAFVLLFVFGYSFQKCQGYDSDQQDEKFDEGSLEGNADENFKNAAKMV
jgi:hypothetical protein